jgi:hypothetical protein
MGRGPEKRLRILCLRVTDTEYRRLKLEAAGRGLTVSELARLKLFGAGAVG